MQLLLTTVPIYVQESVRFEKDESHVVATVAELASYFKSGGDFALIVVGTEWCRYCRIQDKELQKFASKGIRELFIAKFDAEFRDSIRFGELHFGYRPRGVESGLHELAWSLHGFETSVSFPFWVLVDRNYRILDRHKGVLRAEEISKLYKQILELQESLSSLDTN